MSAGLHVPGLSEAKAVTGTAMATGPTHAYTAPSGSALAVEIEKDAHAATGSAEPAHPTQRAGARAPTPSGATPGGKQQAQDDGSLREFGKAVVHWSNDSIPDSAKTMMTTGRSVALYRTALTGITRRCLLARPWVARAGSIRIGGTLQVDPADNLSYDTRLRKVVDAQPSPIGEILQIARTVLEHPMAWLVVALFVIGGLVVKKIDRRPKKQPAARIRRAILPGKAAAIAGMPPSGRPSRC